MIEEEEEYLPDFLESAADDVDEDEHYAEILVVEDDEVDPDSEEVERYK